MTFHPFGLWQPGMVGYECTNLCEDSHGLRKQMQLYPSIKDSLSKCRTGSLSDVKTPNLTNLTNLSTCHRFIDLYQTLRKKSTPKPFLHPKPHTSFWKQQAFLTPPDLQLFLPVTFHLHQRNLPWDPDTVKCHSPSNPRDHGGARMLILLGARIFKDAKVFFWKQGRCLLPIFTDTRTEKIIRKHTFDLPPRMLVTTRMIAILVRNSYKPLFATISGG